MSKTRPLPTPEEQHQLAQVIADALPRGLFLDGILLGHIDEFQEALRSEYQALREADRARDEQAAVLKELRERYAPRPYQALAMEGDPEHYPWVEPQ
jgi:hypothetical protein